MKKTCFIILLFIVTQLSPQNLNTETASDRPEAIKSDKNKVPEQLLLFADSLFSKCKYEESNALLFQLLETDYNENVMNEKQIAKILDGIGQNYKCLGNYIESENYFNRVIDITNTSDSLLQPIMISSLYGLARIKQIQAQYSDAEYFYKKALDLIGPNNIQGEMSSSVILSSLASTNEQQGRIAVAEKLYLQAITEGERTLSLNDMALAKSLGEIASFYMYRGKFDLAESYYLQSKTIIEKNTGIESKEYAFILFFLGRLYTNAGRLDEAEKMLINALELRLKLLQPDDIHIGHTYISLGLLYFRQGIFSLADDYLHRALTIREKALGPFHPHLFLPLQKLSHLNCLTDDKEKGLKYFKKYIHSYKMYMEYSFSTASENQKLRWIRKYPPIDDLFLSYSLRNNTDRIVDEAYNMVLYGKSIVTDAQMAENEIAFCNNKDEVYKKFSERNKLRTTISNIILGTRTGIDNKPDKDSILSLISYHDSLESDLSMLCSSIKNKMILKQQDVNSVKELLPPDVVYWEFVRYTPYDFEKNESNIDSPHYLAFLLSKSHKTKIVDLGKAQTIDSLIFLSRELINNAQNDIYISRLNESELILNRINSQLFNILFEPLVSHFKDKTKIMISPDGIINLIPFDILPCTDGSFVVENYEISYLSSSRDLIGSDDNHNHSLDYVVLFADPDYDNDEILEEYNNNASKTTVSTFRNPFEGVKECMIEEFAQLRFSRTEAMSIAELLTIKGDIEVKEYYGNKATEKRLKSISKPPDILHIATHGFYCESFEGDELVNNPLMKSCLVFAGANRVVMGKGVGNIDEEDGILTAYEVSELNLVGTELVTLSACESGLGEFMYDQGIQGEGVFGLRRAFKHAGAKSILMSLWKTRDKQTAEFMNRFYKHWLGGLSKSKAMRNAMLEMLHNEKSKRNSTHPFLWGGFVLIGN